jgi:hypothetical protein
VCWILYPNASVGRSFSGVWLSTVRISTLSPAFDRNLSISLNLLEYPEVCVKGVGSVVHQKKNVGHFSACELRVVRMQGIAMYIHGGHKLQGTEHG